MKNTVPIIVQTVAKHSYWVESILTGLRKSAEKSYYELDFIGSTETLDRSNYAEHGSIIVIGYVVDWLYHTLDLLLEMGFEPIVVNAGVSDAMLEKSYYELDFIGSTETLDRSNYAEHGSIIVIGYVVDWLYHTLDLLLEMGFEPIVVNAGVSDAMLEKCSAVYFRLEESIENALEYLSLAGRKNICLYGTNNMSLADHIKEDVFLRVMGRSNKNPQELIIKGEKPLNDHIEDFLNCLEEREIDAVFCQNDTLAIHLINRMLNDGFKIPDDLYIVGMGNSLLGQKMAIPLSSIAFDYEELGVQAFNMWRYLQLPNERVHVEVAIPCKFIPRASTGASIQIEKGHTRLFKDISYDRDIEINGDEFYDDDDIQKVLKFEVFLRSCDKIDNLVLEGIVQGISDAKMADMYNISDRAIRYRINKMTKKLGVQTRDEIVNIIKDLRMFSDFIDN